MADNSLAERCGSAREFYKLWNCFRVGEASGRTNLPAVRCWTARVPLRRVVSSDVGTVSSKKLCKGTKVFLNCQVIKVRKLLILCV